MSEIDVDLIKDIANNNIKVGADCAFCVKSIPMVDSSLHPIINERNTEEGELLLEDLVAQALKDCLVPLYLSLWFEIKIVEDV